MLVVATQNYIMCYENKNLYANPFLLSGVTRKEQDIKLPVCTFGHHQKTLLTEEILFFSPKQLTPGWLPGIPATGSTRTPEAGRELVQWPCHLSSWVHAEEEG